MTNNFFKKQKGFTILETLVAIAILLVGISAAFGVAQLGLSSSLGVKDRITAFFLAQEAIEAVRNAKDTNLLLENAPGGTQDSPNWLAGLVVSRGGTCGDNASQACDYSFDISSSNLNFIFCRQTCVPLYINGNGFYTHVGGANTTISRFTRSITIQELSLGTHQEAIVTVTVVWPTSLPIHTFTVSDTISNWFAPGATPSQ